MFNIHRQTKVGIITNEMHWAVNRYNLQFFLFLHEQSRLGTQQVLFLFHGLDALGKASLLPVGTQYNNSD